MFASSEWRGIDTIYVDLDGTLVDVSARYYRLHRDLCADLDIEQLPFRVYWDLKRQKAPLEKILPGATQSIRDAYNSQRHFLIETSDYLKHDRLLPGAIDVLSFLARNYNLVLVTMRHDRALLELELSQLGIAPLLNQMICRTGQNDTRPKSQLISYESRFKTQRAIIVGDSEQDILAGKRLNLGTVAVANGIRVETILRDLKPDALIGHIKELTELLA